MGVVIEIQMGVSERNPNGVVNVLCRNAPQDIDNENTCNRKTDLQRHDEGCLDAKQTGIFDVVFKLEKFCEIAR
jgi:hypothetical protein